MSRRPRLNLRREPATEQPAEPLRHDLGVLLTLAVDAFKRRLHEHLAAAGFDDLGPSFGFVFRSLADERLSLAALAGRLGISSQGALKIAAEMEQRGYIERQDDREDRRIRRLLLTARGRAALREARRFHATVERELTRTLGANDVAATRRVLDALAGDSARDPGTWAGAARPF